MAGFTTSLPAPHCLLGRPASPEFSTTAVSFNYHVFAVVLSYDFNKKLQGNWSWEDPELSGGISLLFLIRNYKEKAGGRIRSSRGEISVFFSKEL